MTRRRCSRWTGGEEIVVAGHEQHEHQLQDDQTERQDEDLQEDPGPPVLGSLHLAGLPGQEQERRRGEGHHHSVEGAPRGLGLEDREYPARRGDPLQQERQQVEDEEQQAGHGAHPRHELEAAPGGQRERRAGELAHKDPQEVGEESLQLHRDDQIQEDAARTALGQVAQRPVGPGGRRRKEEAAEGERPAVLAAAEQEERSRRAERDREQAVVDVGEGGVLPRGLRVRREERAQPQRQLNGGERRDEPRRQREPQHRATPAREGAARAGTAGSATCPAPWTPTRRRPGA